MSKLKSLVILLIVLSLLMSSCVKDESSLPGDGSIELPDEGSSAYSIDVCDSGYQAVYSSDDIYAFSAFRDLKNKFKNSFGYTLSQADNDSDARKIVIGNINGDSVTEGIYDELYENYTERVNVSSLRVIEDVIYISGLGKYGLEIACQLFLGFEKDGSIVLSSDTDKIVHFDSFIYKEQKQLVTYTSDDLMSLSLLSAIFINGSPVSNFGNKTEYIGSTDYKNGYPTVTASVGVKDSVISITQPGYSNSDVATIVSTSKDGKSTTTYKVIIDMSMFYQTSAASVIKDGKKGVLSFVIDDGNEATAEFMVNTIAPKYENISASFAIITKNLVQMTEGVDDNGGRIWAKDENGRYLYTQDRNAWNFWKSVSSVEGFELVSHSHTHGYWGENDNGGVFIDEDGWVSQSFPKGNVSMELFGSNQIIKDMGERGIAFVIPGVPHGISDYSKDMYVYSDEYLGARSTTGYNSNLSKMVNYEADMLTVNSRKAIKAYMIEHYNTDGTTNKESNDEICINKPITYWKNYIDAAEQYNAWSCFCIHKIMDDSYVSTSSGEHFIFESQAEEMFAYANEKNDLWIATFSDALLYYNMKAFSKVNALAYKEDYIDVTLETTISNPDYLVALTVRVDLLDSWTGAALDGYALDVLTDESGSYVLVDVEVGETVKLVGIK